MEVIFLRHGETAANLRHVYQRGAEPLSPAGEAHMRQTAGDLKDLAPTHILHSPLTRATQSAAVLGEQLDITPEPFPEVREVRWPAYLEGRSHRSLTSFRHMVQWFWQNNLHTDDLTAGESYPRLRKRIERAKHILERYPEDARIVVVSHSVFINFFVEHVCNSEHLSLALAGPRLLKVLTLKNTNATQLFCDQDYTPYACHWHLTAFNRPISELT